MIHESDTLWIMRRHFSILPPVEHFMTIRVTFAYINTVHRNIHTALCRNGPYISYGRLGRIRFILKIHIQIWLGNYYRNFLV